MSSNWREGRGERRREEERGERVYVLSFLTLSDQTL
jgi:hypothetical protein